MNKFIIKLAEASDLDVRSVKRILVQRSIPHKPTIKKIVKGFRSLGVDVSERDFKFGSELSNNPMIVSLRQYYN